MRPLENESISRLEMAENHFAPGEELI